VIGDILVVIGLLMAWGGTIALKEWWTLKVFLFVIIASIPFGIVALKFWCK